MKVASHSWEAFSEVAAAQTCDRLQPDPCFPHLCRLEAKICTLDVVLLVWYVMAQQVSASVETKTQPPQLDRPHGGRLLCRSLGF